MQNFPEFCMKRTSFGATRWQESSFTSQTEDNEDNLPGYCFYCLLSWNSWSNTTSVNLVPTQAETEIHSLTWLSFFFFHRPYFRSTKRHLASPYLFGFWLVGFWVIQALEWITKILWLLPRGATDFSYVFGQKR